MTGSCGPGDACACDGEVTGSGTDLTVYSKNFELVCHEGVTYFSACHAGCQQSGKLSGGQTVYYGCGCLNATLTTGKNIAALHCTLGFATMGYAANLALATLTTLTDLLQYINSDLVFSDLKFCLT